MNERIEELLLEAHKQTKGGIYNGHPSEWSEKFAVLIVQECLSIMQNCDGDLDFAIFKTKKHFGVEQ